jgi:hypothetical protein
MSIVVAKLETPRELIQAYYRALETSEPLDAFYASDAEADELGPIVKVGSGKDELFVGNAAVAAAVRRVSATLSENRLESRGPLLVRTEGELALFADTVWWAGQAAGKPFASLTRWTGVARRTARGWRFVQVHVSEEVE